VEITVKIDLSRFSEEELRSFFKDGIISRWELVNELNTRLDNKSNAEEMIRRFRETNNEGKPS